MVDATHLKVRVDHRICPMALMIATGMTRDGVKELIGFRLKACESRETWGEVLSCNLLVDSGIQGLAADMLCPDTHLPTPAD
jgi:putative transposase